jgi:hypothetical protein
MVQDLPFSRVEDEDPHHHLLVFEELCFGLVTPGMTQEAFRWKLFLHSLTKRKKHNMETANGNCEKIRDDFCCSFFSWLRTGASEDRWMVAPGCDE